MTAPLPHRVRTQRWRLRAPSLAEARALRSAALAARGSLDASLARAFDARAPGEELVHVPRLEIRLRIESADQLEDQLALALERSLAPWLAAASSAAERRDAAPAPHRASGGAFAHYLETGSLPWFADLANAEDTLAWLRAAALAAPSEKTDHLRGFGRIPAIGEKRNSMPTLANVLLTASGKAEQGRHELAATDPEIGVRGSQAARATKSLTDTVSARELYDGVRELPDETVSAASVASLALSAPSAQAALAAAFRWLALLTEPDWPRAAESVAADAAARTLAVRALRAITANRGVASLRMRRLFAAAVLVVARRALLDEASERALLDAFERASGASVPVDPPRALVERIEQLTAPTTSAGAGPPRAGVDPARSSQAAPLAAPAPSPAPAASPAPPAQRAERARAADAARERFANAGVLLLHPFLPRLFRALALDWREGFHGEPLARAVAALHYLATGSEDPLEHELGFAKLLLGAQPSAPLFVAPGLLSATDREECDALVAAVIAHWSVLGRSSPAALREGFLKRAALASESDAGWELWFEARGIDVLLGHLPWGIGVVKLPWLARPLVSQWSAP